MAYTDEPDKVIVLSEDALLEKIEDMIEKAISPLVRRIDKLSKALTDDNGQPSEKLQKAVSGGVAKAVLPDKPTSGQETRDLIDRAVALQQKGVVVKGFGSDFIYDFHSGTLTEARVEALRKAVAEAQL